MKISVIGDEAREKISKGADYLADAVKSTIGPHGRNFLLEKGGKVTNDGITIGREIIGSIEDDIERRGATSLLEASSRTNDEAGDGTTTAITLAQAVMKAAKSKLGSGVVAGKMSPLTLINTIEAERVEITDRLLEMVETVDTEERLIEVATVSVEDEELGRLLGTTQWGLGKDGFMIAEETNLPNSSVERINGIRIDNGFGTVAVINNPEKESLEVKDVPVIYTNHTIQTLVPLLDVLKSLNQEGKRDIIVMARAFTNEAIQECLKNLENGFNIYPLNAPYTDQVEVMYDLEALLGGHFINSEERQLSDILRSDVGYASSVSAKRSTTVFTGSYDELTEERIGKRIETLTSKHEGSGSSFEKTQLEQRMAQLKNGFGLIKVGATSDTERKYKKDKVDDAVNAVRAALQEGIVPGAGLALKQVADKLPDTYLLKRAVCAPYEQIQANAGESFDIPEWVYDPVKVIRIALQNACSVAATLSTAGGVITSKTEKPVCCAQSNTSN